MPKLQQTRNEIRATGYIASLEFDRKKLRLVRLIAADLEEAHEALNKAKTAAERNKALFDVMGGLIKLKTWNSGFKATK